MQDHAGICFAAVRNGLPLYLEFENKSVKRIANVTMHGLTTLEGSISLGNLGPVAATHLMLNYNHDVLCAN